MTSVIKGKLGTTALAGAGSMMLVVGALHLVAPQMMMEAPAIQLTTVNHRHVIRAAYGGAYLGIAALFFLGFAQGPSAGVRLALRSGALRRLRIRSTRQYRARWHARRALPRGSCFRDDFRRARFLGAEGRGAPRSPMNGISRPVGAVGRPRAPSKRRAWLRINRSGNPASGFLSSAVLHGVRVVRPPTPGPAIIRHAPGSASRQRHKPWPVCRPGRPRGCSGPPPPSPRRVSARHRFGRTRAAGDPLSRWCAWPMWRGARPASCRRRR